MVRPGAIPVNNTKVPTYASGRACIAMWRFAVGQSPIKGRTGKREDCSIVRFQWRPMLQLYFWFPIRQENWSLDWSCGAHRGHCDAAWKWTRVERKDRRRPAQSTSPTRCCQII